MTVQHRRRAALSLLLLAALAQAACAPKAPPVSSQSPRRQRKIERQQREAAERALQLATFDQAWRRIDETYPYADFRGLDWKAVRDELRPRAAECRTAAQLRPILGEMLGRLGESHFQVLPGAVPAPAPPAVPVGAPASAAPAAQATESAAGDLGLDVRRVGDEFVAFRVDDDGPAAAAGIAPGWSIHAISGLHSADLVARSSGVSAPLSQYLGWAILNGAMRGTPGSIVTVVAAPPGGAPRSLQVVRRALPGTATRLGNLTDLVADFESRTLEGGVGYVRFSMFLTPVAQPFSEAVRGFVRDGAPGVVIDIRGNPGGIGGLVMGMGGHFVREPGKSLGAMKTREGELNFVANPRGPGQQFEGRVAILVDGLSLSTSELFAAGLQQAAGAKLFGERTGGMALPSIIETLPNGARPQFAVADLTAPGGRRIEGVCVAPDVAVPLRKEDLAAGRDAALEAALAWIRQAPDASQETS